MNLKEKCINNYQKSENIKNIVPPRLHIAVPTIESLRHTDCC